MTKHHKLSPEVKAQVVLEDLSGVKSTLEIFYQYSFKPQVTSEWKAISLENASQALQNGKSNG